ncbi:unnamed protein product [Tenebrio molitor]|nr:unnamed protein product [Tenebrio molitor]
MKLGSSSLQACLIRSLNAPKERSHLGTNLVTEVAKLLAQIFQSNVPQKFHLNNVLSWQWNVGSSIHLEPDIVDIQVLNLGYDLFLK